MELAGAERHGRSPRRGERAGASESIEPARGTKASLSRKSARDVEAGAGIEPANRGFADPDLTTWLPRRFSANGRLGAPRQGVNAMAGLPEFGVGR